MYSQNSNEETQAPSKTQRKQAMDELQNLGEELVLLPSERLKKMTLPENLQDALTEARRMTRHDEARRRQMQYIGKIMRGVDSEPIRVVLAELRGDSAQETARLHRLERLRTNFLADEHVLQEILKHYPSADLQHLRSLRRAALKEQEQNKQPRSYRALFQQLKELDSKSIQDTDT